LSKSNSIKAISTSLLILRCFNYKTPELRTNQIVAMSGLPKTTVIRYLASLEQEGILLKNINGYYQLGLTIHCLGQIADIKLILAAITKPYMEKLAEKTTESTELNVIFHDSRVCIQKVDSNQLLKFSPNVGEELPLYPGASGKILLAYLSKEKIEYYYSERLLKSEKSLDSLFCELDAIKQMGVAASNGERIPGASSISVPLLDKNGHLLGGLSVSGATVRFTDDKVEEIINELKRVRGLIEDKL